jgi:hypothetical protein
LKVIGKIKAKLKQSKSNQLAYPEVGAVGVSVELFSLALVVITIVLLGAEHIDVVHLPALYCIVLCCVYTVREGIILRLV